MEPGLHEKARRLFNEARKLSSSEWAGFLRAECDGEGALCDEVLSLLQAQSDGFLGESPVSTETFRSVFDHPERVGPYRILDLLGTGGMGIVYEALQEEPVRRRVALKLIKHGMDTRQVILRFEMERQALALMDHPCIARIFDAGTSEDGRPYFVMEDVKGIPLTEYCDKHRLSIEERLDLFSQICDGVQHAHQRSIVHRDLKPSNILATIEGDNVVPKIIDFGIAKFITPAFSMKRPHTVIGQTLGTLEYMSPEQIEKTAQDIDTRADVYSLGVVLYELLVSQVPLDLRGLGPEARLLRVLNEEPQRPSVRFAGLGDAQVTTAEARRSDPKTLRRQLQKDLDWITMKALHKDRTHRYASASELAADVGRHRQNQPVQAGAPGPAYYVGKFIKRHKVGVLATILLFTALVLGIFGTTFGLMRARTEAAKARQTTAFTQEILSGVDPSVARGEDTTLLRKILDSAANKVDTDLAGQPEVQANVLFTIGDAYLAVGEYDDAEAHLVRSLKLRQQVLGEKHLDTLKSLSKLGELRHRQGKYGEAKHLFAMALEGRRRLLGENHPDVGASLNGLANCYMVLQEHEKAAELYRQAAALQEELLGLDDPQLATTLRNLGEELRHLKRYEEAERALKRSLEIRKRHFDTESPEVSSTLAGLTYVYLKLERLEQARVMATQCIEVRKNLYPEGHRRIAYAQYILGQTLIALKEYDEAKSTLDQAIRSYENQLGPQHENVGLVGLLLGEVLLALGEYDEALARYEHSLRIIEGSEEPDPQDTVKGLRGKGQALRGLGRSEEAKRAERYADEVEQSIPSSS